VRYELLGDRILVKVLDANERTSGGLWIPEMATDNTPWMKAEVLEVGTGRLMTTGVLVPLQVKRGDAILFFRNMQPGDQLVVPIDGGEEALVIREQAVLMILHDLNSTPPLLDSSGNQVVLQ
jgi:chaperonin GroES